MITGRRWDLATFGAVLVAHPLLVHLVRRLLFGAYDAEGKLVELFRVTEDRSFAGAADTRVTLDPAARIGLPHPIDLAPEALATWGSVFADYEILQPFDQLGRVVFTITEGERSATTLDRFQGVRVETGRLFALEQRGWRHPPGGDVMPTIYGYARTLPDGHVAELSISPGIDLLDPKKTPEQTLRPVLLLAPPRSAAPLGELSPVLFSELVRDLALFVG